MQPEDDEFGARGAPENRERNYLALWRLVAIGTCTGLIVFTVVIDSVGRLFLNPAFHVSEILFAALVSSWLVLLGFEGKSVIDKLKGNGNGSR